MINKALQLGGGDWSIYGLQDQGFSNNVRESAGSFRVKMYGYNYDELYDRAEQLKKVLVSPPHQGSNDRFRLLVVEG